jgi:hypothetical protein
MFSMNKISGVHIKIIACLVMLIDHVGAILFPDAMALRWIGRLAFPLFAWQFAVSWEMTSNRMKYTRNLLIFALVSQIPYVLGAGVLALHQLFGSRKWLGWVLFALAGVLAFVLRVDYGFYGMMAIAIFYFLRGDLFNMLIGYATLSVLGMFYFQNDYQWISLFSVVIIAAYNKSVRSPKLNKWLFYGFYPVHILLLAAIRIAVRGV